MIHTFSGNTLDRGDAIRRDQQLVDAAANHQDSLFLGFCNLDVLVHDNEGVSLGWLSQSDMANVSNRGVHAHHDETKNAGIGRDHKVRR